MVAKEAEEALIGCLPLVEEEAVVSRRSWLFFGAVGELDGSDYGSEEDWVGGDAIVLVADAALTGWEAEKLLG